MGYVLIVEDDIVLARMYQKAMEIEGLTVVVAADGERGLAKIREQMPSLVLLDIMMPKMSGYQVLDTLRADDATKELPVVVLTNLHAGEDLQLATSKGANECVVKSKSDPMQVVALAKKYLGQEGAGNGGGQQQTANNQPATADQLSTNTTQVGQPAAAQTQTPVQPAAPTFGSAAAAQPQAAQYPTAPQQVPLVSQAGSVTASSPSTAGKAANPIQPPPVSQSAQTSPVTPAAQPAAATQKPRI